MPVYINGRFLTQRQTGVQRYALETLCALDAAIAESASLGWLDVVVLAPPGAVRPNLCRIGFRTVGPLTGHQWEQITLPANCGASLLLNFANTGPVLKAHQVVTIHDAAVFVVPQTYSRAFRNWYRVLLPLLAKRAEHLVTVSEFSKRELIQHLGPAASRALVSGEGWQHVTRHPADPGVLGRHALRPQSYVLTVGSMTPHKNLAVVARASRLLAKDLGIKVAVAGPADPSVFNTSAQTDSAEIELLGFVSEGELRSLYENAAAFVHPSKYEGFGIPPLEAMALGCPVIASRAAAIPETCGDAAWYFEPDDAETLAGIVREVVQHPRRRDAMVELGRKQVSRHSWRATADCYLSIITGAVAGSVKAAPLAPLAHLPEAQELEPSNS